MDAQNQSTFLILKAAYLYYIKDMPQNEIAAILRISIPSVSRLLKRAREERIIEFVIRDPYIECIHLEEMLEKTFGLKDAVIVPTPDVDDLLKDGADLESPKRLVALEAARYLQRIITEKDVLGVTWGSTIHHMINYLNPAQKTGATFVTLHGSIACCQNDLDVRPLVARMSRAFAANSNHILLAEGLISSKEAADVIRNEPNIRSVFDMFRKITISISGMGSFYPEEDSILSRPEFMPKADLRALRRQGVVCDMFLRFFDSQGRECDTPLRDRTISIPLDQFRKIATKISIVSGARKAHALLAALRGGLIDVLIADRNLAMALADLHRREGEKE